MRYLATTLLLFAASPAFSQNYRVSQINAGMQSDRYVSKLNDDCDAIVQQGARCWLWSEKEGAVQIDPEDLQNTGRGLNQHGVVAFDNRIVGFGATFARETGVTKHVGVFGAPWSLVGSLNNLGQVAGQAQWPNQVFKTFLYTPGQGYLDLGGIPGFENFYPFKVTDDEEVCGSYTQSTGGNWTFRWTRSTGMVDIGVGPGGFNALGLTGNNIGTIVGIYSRNDFKPCSFIQQRGKPIAQLLEAVVDGVMFPYCVNEHDDVTGYEGFGQEGNKAFLWRPGWVRAKLVNDMLDQASQGWSVFDVQIDNKGEMAGGARFNGGTAVPVLLKPESQQLAPSTTTVTGGLRMLGGDQSLLFQDDKALRVAKLPSSPLVVVESRVQPPTDALYLWLKVKSRASVQLAQSIDLFDVVAGAWVSAPTSATTLSNEWQYTERVAVRSLDRYRQADGSVRARIRFEGTGPYWVDLDQATWECVRGT